MVERGSGYVEILKTLKAAKTGKLYILTRICNIMCENHLPFIYKRCEKNNVVLIRHTENSTKYLNVLGDSHHG